MADDRPVPFGYKMGWLALSTGDTNAVVAALGLSDPAEVSWQQGIDAVYGSAYGLVGIIADKSVKVFVSPSVNHWTMVVSDWVTGTGSVDGTLEVEQLITRLSLQFGEAQAFSTYRVIGYEHWMLARKGCLLRSLVHAEDGWKESGEPTPVELGFDWYPLRPYSELDGDIGEEDVYREGENAEAARGWPNEDAVMTVAGAWSVNPSELGPATPVMGHGILATAPDPRRTREQSEPTAHRRPWWRFW